MPTVTYNFYYEDRVAAWEKLEKAGKIGKVQAKLLQSWRDLKQKHPAMNSMVAMRGRCYPARFGGGKGE